MIEVKIENISAIKIFTQKLILNLIATFSEEVEYKPERLSDFVYVLKESSYGWLLFGFCQIILLD